MKINEKLAKDIREQIGDLTGLNTTDKTNLVNAVNEANTNVKTVKLTKSSNQAVNNNYIQLTLQNIAGDTEEFTNNNGKITLNSDFKLLILIFSSNFSSSTQLYYQIFKNNTQVQNGWTSSGWSFPFFIKTLTDVKENDEIYINIYSATANNTLNSSENTYLQIIAFK